MRSGASATAISSRRAAKRASLQASASILFTATTKSRMPSSSQQRRMGACLCFGAQLGIDDQQRRRRSGGARHEVADQLAVAGTVDDDQFAARRTHAHARRVERDGLVALQLQRVERERPLETARRGRHSPLRAWPPCRPAAGRVRAAGGPAATICRGRRGRQGRRRAAAPSHVARGAQAFEGILALMVHRAAGALLGLRRLEFADDFRQGRRPATARET